MLLEDFYMISQVIAALAVMGSLVFVGLQMRQSDKTQRAIMHQARTERNIEIALRFVEPHHQTTVQKAREAGRELSVQERRHLNTLLRVTLLTTEETVWQHRAKLLDDDVMEDQRRSFSAMFSNPVFRVLWKQSREIYSENFAAFVDEVISASPTHIPASEEDKSWSALWDSEMMT